MKKSLLLVTCLLAAFAFSPASYAAKKGSSIDMKTASCEDLGEVEAESKETAALFIFWLDGYLSGVTGDTTFDGDQMSAFIDKLDKYCTANPKSGLLDAAKKVGVQ